MEDVKELNRQRRRPRSIVRMNFPQGQRTMLSSRDQRQRQLPPASVSSGFLGIDRLTGCQGIPLSHITLLTGDEIVGKRVLAYGILANAQRAGGEDAAPVGILDVGQAHAPEDLAWHGIDERYVIPVNAMHMEQSVQLLFSLLCGYGLRAILVRGFAQALDHQDAARMVYLALPKILTAIRQTECAVVFLDPITVLRQARMSAIWQAMAPVAQHSSLHLELCHEQQTRDAGIGSAHANLVKSRWATGGQCNLRFRTLPRISEQASGFADTETHCV